MHNLNDIKALKSSQKSLPWTETRLESTVMCYSQSEPYVTMKFGSGQYIQVAEILAPSR